MMTTITTNDLILMEPLLLEQHLAAEYGDLPANEPVATRHVLAIVAERANAELRKRGS